MKIASIILVLFLTIFMISCTTQRNSTQGVIEIKQGPTKSLVWPVWSPSGDKIVSSNIMSSEHRSTLYVIDLNNYKKTAILTIEGEAIAQSWSVDGENIAVAISQSMTFPNEGIWVFNITNDSHYFVGAGEAAVWSPDGKQLAIFSCTQLSDGNSTSATIRVVDLAKNEEEILFKESSCLKLAYMSWAADNKNIAFSFSEDSTTNNHLDRIFVIDLPTKEVRQILDEGSWSPSFSPTDGRLIFVKNYSLGVTDRAGKCPFEIKDLGTDIVGDVSWSPDGKRWAVSGLGKIYIIDVESFMSEALLQSNITCP